MMNMELLPLGGDIHRPFHCIRYAESGWWIVGAAGQVIHSQDGVRWRSVVLPGTAGDRELLDLTAIYCSGPNVWLVGNPGNVVWCSRDGGESWRVQKTGQSLPLEAIHGFGDERLMAVGPMARILGTRNSGEAWWTENHQGERLGMLNIASTSHQAAWEAMIASTWNHSKHTGLLSLASSNLESRVDVLPDFEAREEVVRSELGYRGMKPIQGLWPKDLRNGMQPIGRSGKKNVKRISCRGSGYGGRMWSSFPAIFRGAKRNESSFRNNY